MVVMAVVMVVVMGACESMRLLQQMECPGLIPSPPFPTATATTATAPIRGGSFDGTRCRVRTCACFGSVVLRARFSYVRHDPLLVDGVDIAALGPARCTVHEGRSEDTVAELRQRLRPTVNPRERRARGSGRAGGTKGLTCSSRSHAEVIQLLPIRALYFCRTLAAACCEDANGIVDRYEDANPRVRTACAHGGAGPGVEWRAKKTVVSSARQESKSRTLYGSRDAIMCDGREDIGRYRWS